MSEKRLRAYLFTAVTIVAWFFYFRTTAPTVVFWDVGEFLATSVILGVPHPPGTPLYVILGKFMTLLPLPMGFLYKVLTGRQAVEPVLRITLIAITSGALSAGFVYLLTVKTLSLWRSKFPPYFAHIAGVFGALIGAFAHTVWFNAIEAETYAPSTVVMFLVTWIMWLWWEKKDNPNSIKYLLFTIYVVVLSSGIHLLSLIILPALFFFVLFVRPEQSWIFALSFIFPFTFFAGSIYSTLLIISPVFFAALWMIKKSWIGSLEIVGASLAALAIRLAVELSYTPTTFSGILLFITFLAFLLYLNAKGMLDFNSLWTLIMLLGGLMVLVGLFSSWNWAIIGSLVATFGLYMQANLHKDWRGLTILLILIALSVEFYLIIRARAAPRINEADPSNWRAFMDVLMRKQYEPAKLFPRRIPFINQLKVFWLYFSWQYDKSQLLIPVVILGLFGLFAHFANEQKSFLLIGGGFLIASLGLLFYLNLKDSPSHPFNPLGHIREVRDRDYFFAPAFQYFALYAGIGLFEVMRLFAKNLKRNWIGPLIGVPISIVMVVAQVHAFYPILDRSRNYIAEDYAYNLLLSPQGKSILFTNGDNDTFPLWFDQEVLKVRPDVIIANLSLLNTNWYCKQLKSWGAPISFTYEQLDSLPPAIQTRNGVIYLRDIMIRDMITTSIGYKPKDSVYLYGTLALPALYVGPRDKFMDEVIPEGTPKPNIYFAITVSPETIEGWQKHLLLDGLAFKVVPNEVGTSQLAGVDRPVTRKLLSDDLSYKNFCKKVYEHGLLPDSVNSFRYRGVFDKRVYKDATHAKLLRNYSSIALRLALHDDNVGLKKDAAEDLLIAKEFLVQMQRPLPQDVSNQLLAIYGRASELEREIGNNKKAISLLKEALDLQKVPVFYSEIGKNYLDLNDTTKAIEYLEMAYGMDPNSIDYRLLCNLYLSKGKTKRAAEILRNRIKTNPRDSVAIKMLEKIKS